MPSLFSSTTRTLAFCMVVALSGLAMGKEESITSANHPALKRALMPTRMQTDNSPSRNTQLSSVRSDLTTPKAPRLLCYQCVLMAIS